MELQAWPWLGDVWWPMVLLVAVSAVVAGVGMLWGRTRALVVTVAVPLLLGLLLQAPAWLMAVSVVAALVTVLALELTQVRR